MRRALVTSGMLLLAACSFILNFDYETPPACADKNGDGVGECLAGYSCMINRCVRNGSVAEGQTCTVNAHCVSGNVCGTSPFVCRHRCTAAYGNGFECATNKACRRILDADDNQVGACLESQCTTTCTQPGEVCVAIKPGVGACEVGCTVTCTGPTCTQAGCPASTNPVICQPLGPAQTLGCQPEGTGTDNQPCDLINNFCDINHACMRPQDGSFGLCMRYCDYNDGTSALCNGAINPATGLAATCNSVAGGTFGICGQLPASPVTFGSRCGDGVVTGFEECDGTRWSSRVPGSTCDAWGMGPTGTLRCTNCRADFSQCAATDYCATTGRTANALCEPCDMRGGAIDPDCTTNCTGNAVCADDYYFDGTSITLTCVHAGQPADVDCGTCGNGTLEGNEYCDQTTFDPLFANCTDWGFNRGTLGCLGNCTPDFTNCIQ